MPKHRSKYFVLKKTQTNLIFSFLVMVFIVITITLSNLFFFAVYFKNYVLTETEGLKLDVILNAAIATFKGRLILLLVTDILVLLIIGVFISHRIAGPIYKISIYLNDASNGKLPENIVLRKTDLLSEFSDVLNNFFKVLRNKIATIKEISNRLPDSEEKKILKHELDFFKLD